MPRTPLSFLQEEGGGGLLKFVAGAFEGVHEGVALQSTGFRNASGGAMFTGRLLGRIAGAPVGVAARGVLGATGLAAKGTIKALPGVAKTTLATTGLTAKRLGTDALGVAGMAGGITRSAYKKVAPSAENLFTGYQMRYGAAVGLEAAGIGLGVLSASRAMDESDALGTIEGYNQATGGMAPALSYDGDIGSQASGLMSMGGTGDLVTALHANRHGR